MSEAQTKDAELNQARDDLAKKLLCETFVDWFSRKARGVAHNRRWFVDVDDVISDVLLTLTKNIKKGTYEHKSVKEFRSYALMTLLSRATNALQKEASHREGIAFSADQVGGEEGEAGFDIADPNVDPVKDARITLVREWIKNLPAPQQRVIELSLQNHRTRDVAAVMTEEECWGEVSPGKAAQWKHQALKYLEAKGQGLVV